MSAPTRTRGGRPPRGSSASSARPRTATPARGGRSSTRSPARRDERSARASRAVEPDRRRSASTAPRRTSQFLVLLALLGLLNVTGLVMVLSASSASSQDAYGSPWYQFQRQAMWLAIGGAVLALVLRAEERHWRRFIPYFVGATLVALGLVLVPGFGVSVNGSARWLGVGSFTIQPSELAKLALLLFAADLLARRARRIHDTRCTLRPVLLAFGCTAVLIMGQPDLGTTVLIFAIVFTVLFVAGVPLRPLGLIAAAAAAAGALFAVIEPYRMRRLLAFTDPWADPLNTGYQTLQGQAAVANGGVIGQGLGQGRAKFGFLPEGHTDFIFANIAEELGLFGALVLLGVFVAMAVVGISVAMRAPDRFGMLVAAGVTTWILIQAFVNLGAVVGVLPITGIPLPFVSAGGSSLVVTMAAYGLLLNVARRVR